MNKDERENNEFQSLDTVLEAALTPRQPRDEFAEELRAQLLGKSPRPRNAPKRLGIAAAVALATGFLLLLLRRVTGDDGGELADDPVPSSA